MPPTKRKHFILISLSHLEINGCDFFFYFPILLFLPYFLLPPPPLFKSSLSSLLLLLFPHISFLSSSQPKQHANGTHNLYNVTFHHRHSLMENVDNEWHLNTHNNLQNPLFPCVCSISQVSLDGKPSKTCQSQCIY